MSSVPRVSVLLPTYNRARFLPAAIDAIGGQSMADWELVVIDDGSTDDTERVVAERTAGLPQPVTVRRQANAGAYGARNTALDLARAPLVAFYDSDDVWLPHHLTACVRAFDEVPDLDWVYAACEIADYGSGVVTDPDTFRVNGAPRPFRQLHTRQHGEVHVFDDEAVVAGALDYGLYCGLQNSVIKRSVFETARFAASYRNEAEDQLFVIRSLKRGCRLGYIDAIHVRYHVHDANSSAASREQSIDRQLAVYRPLVEGFERLRGECAWTPAEARALAQRIARDHFWHIGYAVLWNGGRRAEAIQAYQAGLRAWPWSLACWKTYLTARLRTAFGPPAEGRTA